MKRLLMLLAVMLCLQSLHAQQPEQQFRYRPWSEFQGDTLEYLRANLTPRRTAGIHARKPLVEIIDMLEIPVKYIVYYKTYYGEKVRTVDLIFIDRLTYRYNQQNEIDQLHCNAYFTEISVDEARRLFGAEPEQIVPYTPQLRERIKDLKVEYTPGAAFVVYDNMPF